MKWKRIPKEFAAQPSTGTYRDWKERLAAEADNHCVYCGIHSGGFGGLRNFHVEHYRPKSKFRELENDIQNLFFACCICNVFKSDSWPNEPNGDHSNCCFPDPSAVDFTTLFEVDWSTGRIKGLFTATAFVEERLYLNRPQLINERRVWHLRRRLDDIADEFPGLMERAATAPPRLRDELYNVYKKMFKMTISLAEIPPYSDSEVRRNR